jgi:O-antigen/teichoic acid export membrane protein
MGRTAVATYAAQAYAALISIFLLPLYLQYMGAEGFGLVGLFVVLQAWFTALDLGVPAIITREVARCRGGAIDSVALGNLFRTCEFVFAGIGLLGAGAVMLGSDWVSMQWLTARTLETTTIHASLVLMALACGLRWVSGLYRAVLVGLEQMRWLSAFAAVIATARFVIVLPLIAMASNPVLAFFALQVAVSGAELAGLMRRSYAGLRITAAGGPRRFAWSALREIRSLGLQMALATMLWLLATQSDKILLSRLLSLAEYGYFSVAATAAGVVTLLAAPAALLLIPQLSRLEAAHDSAALCTAYRSGTQAVTAIALSAAGVLAACSESVLWVWTGDRALAASIGPVLGTYAMGNALLAIVAMPYYLQFARGDLRLHNVGTALLALLFIPAVVILANLRGAIGAGQAWLGVTLLYLILWTPVVHARHLPRMSWRWLAGDVGRVALPVLCVCMLAAFSNRFWPSGRAAQLGFLILTAGAVAGVAVASAPALQAYARRVLARWSPQRQL